MNDEHRAMPGAQGGRDTRDAAKIVGVKPPRLFGGRDTRDAAMPEPFAYTIEQAMTLLNCDRRRIYTMIADGTLRTYKHGRRRWASAEALRDAVRKLERASS